jgi:hypothetical protein
MEPAVEGGPSHGRIPSDLTLALGARIGAEQRLVEEPLARPNGPAVMLDGDSQALRTT